jgi:hypothetical protein
VRLEHAAAANPFLHVVEVGLEVHRRQRFPLLPFCLSNVRSGLLRRLHLDLGPIIEAIFASAFATLRPGARFAPAREGTEKLEAIDRIADRDNPHDLRLLE